MPQLRRVELRARRRVLARILEGSWTTLIKGRGMEFAGFRKYMYGDDASLIDWGATLRAKETLIREFEAYKNVNVLFVIDVSDSMLFSSAKKLKAEYAAEVAFNLAAAIIDNGDAVGYILFSDQVTAKLPPAIGKDAIYRMGMALGKPRNYGGGFSFKNMMKTLEGMLKQRALIVILSDFIGVEEGWERYIKMLGQKYDLIGIAVRDPRDRDLPDAGTQALVEDPFTHEKLYIDTNQYRARYREEAAKEELYIRNVFEKAKAGFILLDTGEDLFSPVLNYFKKRSAVIRG